MCPRPTMFDESLDIDWLVARSKITREKIKRETFICHVAFLYQKQSLIYERLPRKIRLGGPRIQYDNARYFERSYFSLSFFLFYLQFRQDSHSLSLSLSLVSTTFVDTDKKKSTANLLHTHIFEAWLHTIYIGASRIYTKRATSLRFSLIFSLFLHFTFQKRRHSARNSSAHSGKYDWRCTISKGRHAKR